MPIKLTSTLEGDLIVEIINVKPGLYISRKDRKHMVANIVLSFPSMSPGLHIVVIDCSVHISQEIFANYILTALNPSFRIRLQACSAIVTTIWRPGLRFQCHC